MPGERNAAMHKISIDLIVDQPRQPENNSTEDQLSVFIEWVVTLALHTHYDLVECENVHTMPLFAELRNAATSLVQ